MVAGMETDSCALIAENPDWRILLAAYAAAEVRAAELAAAERAAVSKQAPPVPVAPPPSIEGAADESESAEGESGGRQRNQIWVRRLAQIEGLAAEQLAPLHGLLIAEGLLQFNLGGREEGVTYRLSRDARQALAAVDESLANAA
jgi:hypothetical protein